MKCYIPKYSGFCSGVSRAVEAAYENLNNGTYMLGEVVHNPIVINELISKGMPLINSVKEIPTGTKASVLIRAHGVSESIILELKNRGINILDKTCTNVEMVHMLVREASDRGLDIIIVGNPNHPEVVGTKGWSNSMTISVSNMKEAKDMIPKTIFSTNGICMVAQTTYKKDIYDDIYEYCLGLGLKIEYHNTICQTTANRQEEVRRLAKLADGFIVIGGKKSSNVSKLYEIALEYCCNTQYVEFANEIDISKLDGVETLVISSGASTPEKSTLDAIEIVKSYCDEKGMILEIIK